MEFWQHAADLQPLVADFWEGLANAQGQSGDLTNASISAKKAVELQPTSDAKKWIQQ